VKGQNGSWDKPPRGVDNLCTKNILFRIVHKIMLYLD